MTVLALCLSLVLLAAVAHVGSSRDKQSIKEQLLNGICAIALRLIQLVFAIHCSFQAWVQDSLSQARIDMQELLQGDDTDVVLAKRQELSDLLASLPQRPEHLAVALPETSVRENEAIGSMLAGEIDDVEVLCAWSLLAKIPRLSIYSRDGSLDCSFDSIAGRLRNSKMLARGFNGRTPDICLESSTRSEHICANSDTASRPDIYISLWSRKDGYPSLTKLAQKLSRRVQAGELASAAVIENLVADELRDPHGYKHPDLLLLLDDLPCVNEFPPWQLQNAELVQISSGARSLGDAVYRALLCFAKIEMRWGK
ncbi:hypothetical protein IWW36_002989 [Coemansia brasiliensis]|uniref:ditrans,polycis-polyprenyl diphosphate synthase [(2E,6E)-farnesyldiphosphate specific] n=1 Tax=Coemansia brasiliensis TaxID=2650707 RepID=A0A9W8M055_9FUNG|nr:hypothetical protein IWW36_002989 [Coemansia brasiliensis]